MSTPLLSVVRCADITPAQVQWLWEPYLARGKLAVLDGDPGTGKSFVTIDLAARLSTNSPLPGQSSSTGGGPVLLLNAEDDARDTIYPRVSAAGGDLNRIRVLAPAGLGLDRLPRVPEDLGALEAAIRESSAVLVVIDPMMAFFPPGVSANSDQSIRTALRPLAALAVDTGACVLLVRHLRKTGGGISIYRGLGSIGIMGAVRTGLLLSRHPDDPDLRVLAQNKSNIGRLGPSLGFRLTQRAQSGQTAVEWTGPVDVIADDLLGNGIPLRAGTLCRERAAEWLRAFLAEGKRRATEVSESARAAGIAERTLNRVKRKMGVKSDALNCAGKIEWWWRDPAAAGNAFRKAFALEPIGDPEPVYELEGLKELEIDLDPPIDDEALRAAKKLMWKYR